MIRPGEVTVYEADKKTPWKYVWIAFNGAAAAPFDNAPSVFDAPDQLYERLANYVKAGEVAPEIYLSLLYELIYKLFQKSEKNTARTDVDEICRYICYNYMKPLQTGELAVLFGFERNYLYRLFKKKNGSWDQRIPDGCSYGKGMRIPEERLWCGRDRTPCGICGRIQLFPRFQGSL